jgi:hypothetical protein
MSVHARETGAHARETSVHDGAKPAFTMARNQRSRCRETRSRVKGHADLPTLIAALRPPPTVPLAETRKSA